MGFVFKELGLGDSCICVACWCHQCYWSDEHSEGGLLNCRSMALIHWKQCHSYV